MDFIQIYDRDMSPAMTAEHKPYLMEKEQRILELTHLSRLRHVGSCVAWPTLGIERGRLLFALTDGRLPYQR